MAIFMQTKVFDTVIEANIFAKNVNGRVEFRKNEKGETVYLVIYCS